MNTVEAYLNRSLARVCAPEQMRGGVEVSREARMQIVLVFVVLLTFKVTRTNHTTVQSTIMDVHLDPFQNSISKL